MKRTRMLLAVTVFTAATLLAYALPALANSPSPTAGPTVYYPYGNGLTYSCGGGPPFVVDPSSPQGNCALEQIGSPPSGTACDEPTPITFVHDGRPETHEGMLCR